MSKYWRIKNCYLTGVATVPPRTACFNSIDVKKYIDKNIGWYLTLVGVYIYCISYKPCLTILEWVSEWVSVVHTANEQI